VTTHYSTLSEQVDWAFHEYLPVQKALDRVQEIRNNPQVIFEEKYRENQRFYKDIRRLIGDPKDLYLIIELSTRNGTFVLQEIGYRVSVNNCEEIPSLEAEKIEPIVLELIESQTNIPALDDDYSSHILHEEDATLVVLDYGTGATCSNDEAPYANASKEMQRLKQLAKDSGGAVYVAIYEGDSLAQFVEVSDVLGQIPLDKITAQTVEETYQSLSAIHSVDISDRGNRIVGIGIYDTKHMVLHRKLDADFELNAEDSGIYYPSTPKSPFPDF